MRKDLKAHRILRRIRQIEEDEIKPLRRELEAHQQKCKHKKAVQEYKANTGNWDRSQDSYWTNIYCPTCLKEWTVDSDSPEYNAYTEVNAIRPFITGAVRHD